MLRLKDFQDIDRLMEEDILLVYSVCYVTTRFLPGGQETRALLLPKISEILSSQFLSTQKSAFSTLKALVILYTYANLPPSTETKENLEQEDLPFWSLKSLLELHALRLSLHRSVQELEVEIASASPDIFETEAFQKYTYWLWLFTMSQ